VVRQRRASARIPGRISAAILTLAIPALADTAAVLPFWNQPPPSRASNLDANASRTPNSGGARPPNPTAARPTNMEWIGESIAQTVREALASRGVLGFERNEVEEALHRLGLRDRAVLSQASVIKIGEELDAEQVVFGDFQFIPAAPRPAATPSPVPVSTAVPVPPKSAASAGSLRISARVLDRRRMRLGAEFIETGALEDLATIEAHLAWRALTLLAPKLAPPESEFKTLRPAIRLDAEESYVRGLLAQDSAQKEKFFLQAARLDARFAQPCYQLGQIHYQRKEYRQAAEWLEKIPGEDAHFRAASFLLGLARFQSGDYQGAQKAFQIIAETVPLSEVYNNLGAAESRRNLPQAIDDFRKAVEGDATDPVYLFNLGYALWKKGDLGEAADRFRAVLDRDPQDQTATLLLGRCLKKAGPRAGVSRDADARLVGIERLKTNYDESVYWQLKAVIGEKE
jgi:tetratricopeptide (TPR) repeat protein